MDHARPSRMSLVKTLVESGQVERLHCCPHHRPYTVAHHCWGVVALLYALHPDPSKQLIWACMFHDVAERFLGDMPYPGKHNDGELERVFEAQENSILYNLGLKFDLSPVEQNWLKALDLLELYLYCLDERAMGNTLIEPIIVTCDQLLFQSGWVPRRVTRWLVDVDEWERGVDAP